MTKFYQNCHYFVEPEPEIFHLASALASAKKSGSSRLWLHNTVYMRIIDHNHIFRPKNKQLNSTVPTSVMCNKQIFKNCFWVPRDSGDLQNFLKNPKVSDLTPGRANINFYTQISLVSEVSRYQGKIGQRPITKKNGTNGCNTKLFGFAAIRTIYETPF